MRQKATCPTANIYIYIYIYIYCHPQIDCFVVSQLFSVARHAGCFKVKLKPAQLYVRLSILPLSHVVIYASSEIIRHYLLAFVCLYFALPDTRVLNSLEKLCITQIAAVNSFASVREMQVGKHCIKNASMLLERNWYKTKTYYNYENKKSIS